MESFYNSLFSDLVVSDDVKAIIYILLFWFVITTVVLMINQLKMK